MIFFLAFWQQAAIYSRSWSQSVLVKSHAAIFTPQVFLTLPEASRFFTKEDFSRKKFQVSGLKIDCPIFYLL